MQLSRAASVTQRMPREQARFSLATWRNHEISTSRRARVSEQNAQTCVEDRVTKACVPSTYSTWTAHCGRRSVIGNRKRGQSVKTFCPFLGQKRS